MATLLLAISAIVQPALAADRCVAPRANPPMTLETLRRHHGDARPVVVAAVNLALAEDDCLRQAAYRARRSHGPIEAAAGAIVAQCAPAFRAYEAAQAKAATSPAALAAGRKDDRRKTAQMALGYAHAYRTCAR